MPAVGMGLFWLMYFVPMALLPPLAGLARDVTDAAAAPLFTALALAAFIAFPPAVWCWILTK